MNTTGPTEKHATPPTKILLNESYNGRKLCEFPAVQRKTDINRIPLDSWKLL